MTSRAMAWRTAEWHQHPAFFGQQFGRVQ